jgi:hypothetical protein
MQNLNKDEVVEALSNIWKLQKITVNGETYYPVEFYEPGIVYEDNALNLYLGCVEKYRILDKDISATKSKETSNNCTTQELKDLDTALAKTKDEYVILSKINNTLEFRLLNAGIAFYFSLSE